MNVNILWFKSYKSYEIFLVDEIKINNEFTTNKFNLIAKHELIRRTIDHYFRYVVLCNIFFVGHFKLIEACSLT